MEVSSVSPPPTSPTEGDDSCAIDVTNVAIHSVTLLISLCGLAGNGAVLWLIIMNDITDFIFNLAVADFLFLIFALPSALLFLLEDVSCSPIMPQVYVSFLFQQSMVSCYWGLLWLTAISDISDINELCLLCCRWDLPHRLLWVMDSVQFWAFFALITVIPMVTFLCPSHQQEHCQVGFISVFAIILLLFAAPMVISRSINFIQAKSGSKKQRPNRRDTVIFLTVLFTLFLNLWNVLQQLGYTDVSSMVFFLLACIHSSIKPFIYFLTGRCWRRCSMRSLQRVFGEPGENTPNSKATAMDSVI